MTREDTTSACTRTPLAVALNLWAAARFGDFALKHLANDDSAFGVGEPWRYNYRKENIYDYLNNYINNSKN